MEVPLEIRFHNLDPSDALETAIRERAAKLEKVFPRLTSCRVSVEEPHRQHRKGNLFEVHVELGVPGARLAITREPHHVEEKYASPDAYAAVHEAFDAAERRLRTYKEEMQDFRA